MQLLTRMRHTVTKRERKASEERLNTYQHYLENGELPDRESRIQSWWDFLQIKVGDLGKSGR